MEFVEVKREIDYKKCAEIFHLDSHLEIMCTYCLKNFERIHEFCYHLLKEHLNIQNLEFLEQFFKEESNISISQKNYLPKIGTFDIKDTNVIEKSKFQVDELLIKRIEEPIAAEEAYVSNIVDYKKLVNETNGKSSQNLTFHLEKKKRKIHLKNFAEMGHGNYSCNIYNRLVNKYKIREHMKSHKISRYKCITCSKLFLTEIKLSSHIKNCQQKKKLYKCESKDCNRIFTEEKSLTESLKFHRENYFKCLICLKKFVYETGLKKHNLIHLPTTKQLSNEVNSIYTKNKTGKKSRTESIINTMDHKNLSSQLKKNQHLKIKGSKSFHVEKEVKKVICDICGKSTSKYKLSQHLKSHDASRYSFQCNQCKKMFISEKSLKNHIKAIHIKEFPFECNWQNCNKKFANQYSLNAHMIRHTSDRPFKCHVCSKSFIYEYKRDNHYKIYHVNGRIYKCDICNKRFYEQHNLNKHKISHSTDKPYACDECPAKFLRERCLQWHKKQHTGIKEYTCKICGKEYTLYNGIYAHMKTHGIKYSLDYEKGITDGKS